MVLTGWIDQDRKLAGLKALRGMIWEEGLLFTYTNVGDVTSLLEQLFRYHGR